MSPADRFHVLVFLAGLFGVVGFLCMLLSCGTQYWLLISEEEEEEEKGDEDEDGSVQLFHEGLLWRCAFRGRPDLFSEWSMWIVNQPSLKVCEPAFLFPFPVLSEPRHSHASAADSAIVFRTFWSVFLIMGVVTVVIGGFLVICAVPLANHRLYKAGGAFQLSGGVCLLVVVLMFVVWVHVLDTLEVFASHQRLTRGDRLDVHNRGDPAAAYRSLAVQNRGEPAAASYHLTVHNGPSFLLAPVAGFFCLLSGMLFIAAGRKVRAFQNKC